MTTRFAHVDSFENVPFPQPCIDSSNPDFNLTRHKDVHTPLAMSCFALYGLQSYQILRLSPKASQDCPTQTIMTWDSEEGMCQVFAAHGAEMTEDLKNFSHVGNYLYASLRQARRLIRNEVST
jgi:hypothetical protein